MLTLFANVLTFAATCSQSSSSELARARANLTSFRSGWLVASLDRAFVSAGGLTTNATPEAERFRAAAERLKRTPGAEAAQRWARGEVARIRGGSVQPTKRERTR